jgi:predicted LPLAT superfamily acyltransferase
MAEKKWEGTTFGNGLMHRWLIGLLRRIDVRIIYVFAYVFVVPPCLLRPGYKFIYRYFRERFGLSPLAAFWKTYLQHGMFAQAVIDKFAMYAGKRFDIDIEGYEHFERLAKRPEGFVQLSSHVGNYEIAGYSLVAENKPFNALVFFGEKASVMENRMKMFEHTNIRMIPIREDMSHLFELDSALSNGQTVSIPGDRIWGSSKTVTVNILGHEARLPMGPFKVITTRALDAIVVHVVKVAARRYKIFVTPLNYDKEASRNTQVEQLSTQYAAEVERVVRLYPTQWYNYFPFWGTER